MPYQLIEDYGVIGNLRTAALIAKNGSIDWFCIPRFDSPSVFANILDDKKGGYFRIYPVDRNVTLKQLYWPDSNILLSRFLSTHGVGEITDFMPMRKGRRLWILPPCPQGAGAARHDAVWAGVLSGLQLCARQTHHSNQ